MKQNIFIAPKGVVIDYQELTDTIEACQIQIDEHFSKVWDKECTLILVENETMIPQGAWYIFIQSTIDVDGARGYHWVDSKGIPYGLIKLNPKWSITLSHELMEMLVNAFINLKAKGKGIADGRDVDYMIEVADVTYADYGYEITVKSGRKVMVSDFFYPSFFFGTGIDKTAKYSYTGLAKAPRELPDGGVLAYTDHLGETYQALMISGKLQIKKLGANVGVAVTDSNKAYFIGGAIALLLLLTTLIIYKKSKK
jgi:hypothetical protein